MDTQARRIGFGPLQLEQLQKRGGREDCPSPAQGRKYLCTYCMDKLEELLRIDIGNLNRFTKDSEWFRA